MNQPIAKELAKIEALTSIRKVINKKGARDRALTQYEKTAQDWNLLPLNKLSTQETSKKLSTVKNATELYHALQTKFEKISMDDEHFSLEDEQESAAPNLKRCEELLSTFEEIHEAQTLLAEGNTVHDALLDLYELKTLDTPQVHEELKELFVRVAEFRKQVKHYQSNALLTYLREYLREQRGKIMARLNDEQRKIVATAPTAESISTPATPSSCPDFVGSEIKLNLPTFDGNPANWTYFWSRFEQVIQAEKGMVEPLKVSALVDAMKDSKAKEVAERAAQDGYAAMLDAL